MANYVKGTETKRQLVLLTYDMLCERAASDITVRDIANAHGCSPAAIYRHFESLDYLIVVASIKFMGDYMHEYAQLMDQEKPFLDIYLDGWRLFNRYAFERPDVYYRLFWGRENANFGDALQEYYELFPFDGSEKYLAYYYTLMFTEDMLERDMIMLRQAVNKHLLGRDAARDASQAVVLIERGLISEAVEATVERRVELHETCDRLIRQMVEWASRPVAASDKDVMAKAG